MKKWVNAFALLLIKQALSTPKTRQQLIKITKLPERTLRYNLAILKKQGMVKEIPPYFDLRKKLFLLKGENDE
ncbi:MAG: MarR family transcriptional regulator [Candidatus Aenigmarchaeota archaeon]|nr:MarR family transcriptional regulator [Candidatus Aenigmarchaeota archaeon]